MKQLVQVLATKLECEVVMTLVRPEKALGGYWGIYSRGVVSFKVVLFH